MKHPPLFWLLILIAGFSPIMANAADPPAVPAARSTPAGAPVVREVAVGNLVYAGTKTSKCFSGNFIAGVGRKVGIPVRKDFVSIRTEDPKQLAGVAFAVMTGEGSFTLTTVERTNLRQWLENGGFLLASASCSSKEWSASFRAEMRQLYGASALTSLEAAHPLFRTLHDLRSIPLKHDGAARFEGVIQDGRLVCLFSPEGLNDTKNVKGCCCCGGNEVVNAEEVVSNALVYALVE